MLLLVWPGILACRDKKYCALDLVFYTDYFDVSGLADT
jgi:hypothetical protein